MKTMEAKKSNHILRRLRRSLRANEAVSALEYALLVGVIATVIAGALVTFSGEVKDALTKIQKEVKEAATEVDD